jgi:hypothetical protein
MHTHAHAHTRTRTHTHASRHTHTHTRTHTHTPAHAHTSTHARTHAHTNTHTCTRTRTRVRAHTRTRTHAEIHTRQHRTPKIANATACPKADAGIVTVQRPIRPSAWWLSRKAKGAIAAVAGFTPSPHADAELAPKILAQESEGVSPMPGQMRRRRDRFAIGSKESACSKSGFRRRCRVRCRSPNNTFTRHTMDVRASQL